jgi:hypothetical protein
VQLFVENGEVRSLMAGGYGKVTQSLNIEY